MSLAYLQKYTEMTTMTGMNNIPVKYDNIPFVQPDTVWGAVCIIDGKSAIVNLGTLKVDRHVGFVQFDVMVPQNTGTRQAAQLAEQFGKLFRDKIVSLDDGAKVVFKSPQFITLGISNGFYRMCCRVAYWRDEIPQ